MKKSALTLALTLAVIASASAGQYSSEVSQNVKQGRNKPSPRMVQASDHIVVGQYSALRQGPKSKATQKRKTKTSATLAIQSKPRPLTGQYSDNGAGPKT